MKNYQRYTEEQIEELIDKELLQAYRSMRCIPLSDAIIPEVKALVNQNVYIEGFPDVLVQKIEISSREKGREIDIFRCAKENVKENPPAFLFIHGGGYVVGSAKSELENAKRLADLTSLPVFSVEYRLAPEHPYPAGLEDCYDALVYLSENAEALGIDKDKIAIYGGSAGGGMCACLSLYARDMKGPKIAMQVLLCPMLDDRQETPSSHQLAEVRAWNRQQNTYAWKSYLKDLYGTDKVPYTAAPSRCEDLSGLPPTLLTVGTVDLFRDEDIAYATRLMQHDVPTELHVVPGLYHSGEGSPSRPSERMNAAIKRYICDFFEESL
ncbi:MAG TPA: alpha/beta hydrolase [Thermotogota bacterium]|nr:alpha/beta hydrolase [Thermotogota bacterium]